ncbi:MAG: c-type cytochrome [Tepidimonas ignava]|uniref:Cytochrome c n=1 Tax=Tepidimonas ignava TaxID=114249 RepID=A0A4R3LCV6_9BURK|nr:c-type cytochrome [Tepidimonas ignava]TCS97148.1 cytochrome c [Tepidimonas ignava]TSE22382.1 Cytochrome c-552 [Tepidimonas ignava]
MKRVLTMAVVAGVAALTAPVHAMDAAAAKALAQKNACMGCHAVDKKLVGPAYKDIAAKYKGMKPEELAASIKKGGAGKWGPVPMPAQAALSDADAKLLAEWVLAGAPDK